MPHMVISMVVSQNEKYGIGGFRGALDKDAVTKSGQTLWSFTINQRNGSMVATLPIPFQIKFQELIVPEYFGQ